MLLRVKNLTVHYETAKVLSDVCFEAPEGAVVAVIGSNGSGKTTLLKTLSGLKPASWGGIWFRDERIDGMAVHEIAKRGIIHIPEGRRLFYSLTVLSNLRLGAYLRDDKDGIERDLEAVFQDFPALRRLSLRKAGTLSAGEQQMLAIGRALMARPKLLLMDEPSHGLAPTVVDNLVPLILRIKERGVTIILVEQNVPLALRVSEVAHVLQTGRIVMQGPSDELGRSQTIKNAYFWG